MYNRKESEEMLIRTYGYKSCGSKHEENIFTKWYQNFYLFEKFGIDKRKCFYSSLINVGQVTRAEAMELLKTPPEYPVLGIEADVMRYSKRRHEDFKVDWLFPMISKIIRLIRK